MRIRLLASLRWRLGIGVIAIVVLGVLIADIATFVVARNLYEQRISESLNIISSRLVAAEGESGAAGYSSDASSILITDPYIALYAGDGALISERLPVLPDGQQPPAVPPPSEIGGGIRDVVTPGESNGLVVTSRQLTPAEQFSVVVDGREVVVEALVVGLTSARVAQTFSGLIRAQLLAGLIILAAAVGGVVVLLRVGLRPLVRVAQTAEEISAGDLSRRIPIDEPGSEIGVVSLALNDAFDQVEQSENRMRDFVADASHELRTPLATIRGWADLYLSNGIREWDDVDTAMTRIRSESDRLGDLVEQLLKLARLDAQVPGQIKPLDLPSLVTSVADSAAAMSPDHRVTSRVSGAAATLVDVPSDEVLMRQVLMNLVSNATRHTPAGCSVVLDLDAEPDGDAAVIRVIDDGPGMSTEQLAHAYDRFWRADPGRGPTGGTGLGLAIVRGSVLALGGTIDLESRPSAGLTVTVRLPLDRGRTSHS